MNEMIERVAKAKWAQRQKVARKFGITPPLADWADELETLRDEVRADARAGIEAMREPTPQMWEAAANENGYVTPEAWQAMIDAALK